MLAFKYKHVLGEHKGAHSTQYIHSH